MSGYDICMGECYRDGGVCEVGECIDINKGTVSECMSAVRRHGMLVRHERNAIMFSLSRAFVHGETCMFVDKYDTRVPYDAPYQSHTHTWPSY